MAWNLTRVQGIIQNGNCVNRLWLIYSRMCPQDTFSWCFFKYYNQVHEIKRSPSIASISAVHFFFSPKTLPPVSWLISSPPSWPPWRQTVSLWCTTLGIHIFWLWSSEQSRLFTWLMSKWDFNSVTQPSPCGYICMSAFLIWKPSLLRTKRD